MRNNIDETRQRVRDLKFFYTNLVIYTAVCGGCFIIWLCMGAGPFWPIWVIFGCGLAAISQAISLGCIPHIQHFLPFLKADWEEEQIEKMRGKKCKDEPSKQPSETNPTNKK
ncbi:MAG: 2TM domain-containing protein [Alphaproteobacteria bacterium]